MNSSFQARKRKWKKKRKTRLPRTPFRPSFARTRSPVLAVPVPCLGVASSRLESTVDTCSYVSWKLFHDEFRAISSCWTCSRHSRIETVSVSAFSALLGSTANTCSCQSVRCLCAWMVNDMVFKRSHLSHASVDDERLSRSRSVQVRMWEVWCRILHTPPPLGHHCQVGGRPCNYSNVTGRRLIRLAQTRHTQKAVNASTSAPASAITWCANPATNRSPVTQG